MKKLLLVVSLVTISQWASAVEMADLVGKYKVTHPSVPFATQVSIDARGVVSLVETTAIGKLECSGQGKLVGNVLTSNVTCKNKMKFTQVVTLPAEIRQNSFTAQVYSTLYRATLEMNFERQ